MSDSQIAPARRHKTLTTGRISPRPRSIYCYAAGTITLADEDGTELPYALTAGQSIPFAGVSVVSTGSGTFYGWS
jgi:hypothetical protein